MTLSADDSRLVSDRETLLTEPESSLVRDTLVELFSAASVYRVPTAKDDRVAVLEAALIRYVMASRPAVQPAVAVTNLHMIFMGNYGDYAVHRASTTRMDFRPTSPEHVTITRRGDGAVLHLDAQDATDFLERLAGTNNMADLCESAMRAPIQRGTLAAPAAPAPITLPLQPTADDLEHFAKDYMRDTTDAIRERIVMERAVVRRAATELLSQDFALRVHYGNEEGWGCDITTDPGKVMEAIMACDEEALCVYSGGDGSWRRFGTISLVYGNAGWEVVSDYSVNLEPHLLETNAYVDQLGDAESARIHKAYGSPVEL